MVYNSAAYNVQSTPVTCSGASAIVALPYYGSYDAPPTSPSGGYGGRLLSAKGNVIKEAISTGGVIGSGIPPTIPATVQVIGISSLSLS